MDKKGFFAYSKKEPLGVTAIITPWNSPLMLLAWKLAPALAAGCTVVIKPSEFTSATTVELAALFTEAGLPPGVINVVTGFGDQVGAPLVEHPLVRKITFTGSDVTGRKIRETAGHRLKHVSLELGGKSPNIIFADADLDAAVNGAISGIFAATGQTCIAGSRLLVQREVHDDVVSRLVELAATARMGDPLTSPWARASCSAARAPWPSRSPRRWSGSRRRPGSDCRAASAGPGVRRCDRTVALVQTQPGSIWVMRGTRLPSLRTGTREATNASSAKRPGTVSAGLAV